MKKEEDRLPDYDLKNLLFSYEVILNYQIINSSTYFFNHCGIYTGVYSSTKMISVLIMQDLIDSH